jgi:hypothetical protein
LQALSQHSKAVEDLTAAAAILPGDKEVRALTITVNQVARMNGICVCDVQQTPRDMMLPSGKCQTLESNKVRLPVPH